MGTCTPLEKPPYLEPHDFSRGGISYHAKRDGDTFIISPMMSESPFRYPEKATVMYHHLKQGEYLITRPSNPAEPAADAHVVTTVAASFINDLGYAFWLPIGDWSGDGHEKCENFHIISNKPIEDVREAHFAIKEKLGFDIEAMCSRYEDSVPQIEQWEALRTLGINVPDDSGAVWCPDDMASCWLTLLMMADPGLRLKYRKDPDVPMIQFYGNDDKGRHISSVGYGLFLG